VLNDAVDRAEDDQARAIALVARGDVHLHRRDLPAARADYERALALAPDNLVADVGLAEVLWQVGEAPPFDALLERLKALPRRSAGRLDLLRRFARLADRHAQNAAPSAWAWGDVLAETPADPEAQRRAAAIARKLKDAPLLERSLRAQLTRDPRGARARQARGELITLLADLGRKDEATAELNVANKVYPAHGGAWIRLSDAIQKPPTRGQLSGTAVGLDRATTSPGTPYVRPEAKAERWDIAIGQVQAKKPRLSPEHEALFGRVREDPLDAMAYRALSEALAKSNEGARAALIAEIGAAVTGAPYSAIPQAPRVLLVASDRVALRPTALQTEGAELLSLVGHRLCRLFPTKGRAAGSDRELTADAGPGALAAVDALQSCVQILGVQAPEVHVAEDNGPPFSIVFPKLPRLLVGQMAVRTRLPPAELRFFAGRALFTQHPDLAALRVLPTEQLGDGLKQLDAALLGAAALGSPARAILEGLSDAAVTRIRGLWNRCGKSLDTAAMVDGARHAANRAGLVACGGVGPAVAALRAKKALDSEIAELLRYAASDHYFELRSRQISSPP
jgi:tetratricopeptide (TPR) repeat protein